MCGVPEVWLRGAIPGVHPLLMPAVHSLLQTREEVERTAASLTPEQFWAQPAGAPSVGFHLRHLAGSLDRLLTYARGAQLSAAQHRELAEESSAARPEPSALLQRFEAVVASAVAQIQATDVSTLTEPRQVGRARLPSTVIGLTFHAAEHSQRHAGQLMTTARIVRGE